MVYLSIYAVLELHDTVLEGYNVLYFVLSFIPCFFLGSSYAFGVAAKITYLRLFPRTLIAGFFIGTGLSGLLSGSLNLMSQLIDGFSLKYLYLVLFAVGIIYLLFMCTFRILKEQERKIQREEKASNVNLTIIRDSSVGVTNFKEKNKKEIGENTEEEGYPKDGKMEIHKEEEGAKIVKVVEDKELEEMNKAN